MSLDFTFVGVLDYTFLIKFDKFIFGDVLIYSSGSVLSRFPPSKLLFFSFFSFFSHLLTFFKIYSLAYSLFDTSILLCPRSLASKLIESLLTSSIIFLISPLGVGGFIYFSNNLFLRWVWPVTVIFVAFTFGVVTILLPLFDWIWSFWALKNG